MRLGIFAGYWGATPPARALDVILEADRIGLDSVWTAEAYGSDALTPLAWYGAHTSRLRLGTAIMQMQARTPAATAMAAITLDHLSGGRFALGIGASGPQVVEGWHGQAFGRPLARTREYVEILRTVFSRTEPLKHRGLYYQIPFEGGTGLGRPLKSIVHPLRNDLPILLGAQGPKNVALAAELCDGVLLLFFGPKLDSLYRQALESGFSREGARHTFETFEVMVQTSVIIDEDVERAADQLRPALALYIGGMGAAEVNFHRNMFVRLGYEAECDQITRLYLSGHTAEAIAAVPTKLIEDIAIIGPREKVRAELRTWQQTIATGFITQARTPEEVDVLAELFEVGD